MDSHEPTITLTLDLDQAALFNAALAQYWLHLRRSASPELQPILPQVADLQRHLVEQVRAIHQPEARNQ